MSIPCTARRPRSTFRLRTLLVLVLAMGGGLGWIVHRARTQRDAVGAIVRSGGHAYYDWEVKEVSRWDGSHLSRDFKAKPRWPKWLIDALGPDYFGRVRIAVLDGAATDEVMRSVGRLRQLDSLHIQGPSPPTDAGMAHLEGLTRLRSLLIRQPITRPGLEYLRGLTRLERLMIRLDGPRLTDHDLAPLARLVELRNLSLRSPRITSAGLVHLRGMTHLSDLNLSGTGVDDLSPIHHLTGLRQLGLNQTPITDAGLAPIANFKSLQSLLLSDADRITDAGMASLRDLPSLTDLGLRDTRIGDVGAAHLSKLPRLAELGLMNTAITDAGLVHLGRLSSLTKLGLQGTRVTDGGLMHLSSLPGLLGVGVQNTRVTSQGAAALMQASPRVRVVR